MAYRAAIDFADLQDGRWLYHAGDPYPRDGLTVSPKRIAELAGSDNLAGKPLIVAVAEPAREEPAPAEPVEEPKKRAPRKRGKPCD